jgi:hypothetical protein
MATNLRSFRKVDAYFSDYALRAALGILMKNYSIVRSGSEYIVLVDDKSVLKVASRRQAVRLVTDAVELLYMQEPPSLLPQTEPSSASDSCEVS